jgi:C4-dicarboxylate-binding protein DctP
MRIKLVAAIVAAFAGFGVAGLGLAGSAKAQQPIVIKFSHVVSPDAPKGKAAMVFKDLVEKYTNGRVKVEVYPNSSLYKDKEELEALQLGSVQILAPSISKFGPLGVKEFDVFDLPFLMSDDARARQMMASPMMADLNKKLEAKGVEPLAYWDNGAHVYTANKPLLKPEDFRGLKMRIQGSKVLDAAVRELGAIPQIMAFGELYQALQTGVVDGEDNVPSNILTQKFYEVQKNLTVSYHGRLTYALVTNKKFWDGLPADLKEPLARAVKESTDYFNATAAKDNDDALEKIKASGKVQVHYLTDGEKKAWVAKLMPVHKEMQSRFGKDFIDKIYKASGFTPPQS